MDINTQVATKVLDTVRAGLVSGIGKPIRGQMCVEAAVCFALGLPHGDDPQCVAQSLRRLKIRLNDSRWSSDQARAKGLERLALAQLGSAGALDEVEFAKRCARLAIQTSVPAALRAAASLAKGTHKEKLLNAADLCEREPTGANARSAQKSAAATYAATANAAYAAAYAANAAYAATYAANAAYAATYAATAAAATANAAYAATYADANAAYANAAYAAAYAANAAYAATYAANAAYAATYADAYAATYAAAAPAAYAAAARDKSLANFCEGVVQILIAMKAPGCKWLYMTEEQK